jgi:hypothetical protein
MRLPLRAECVGDVHLKCFLPDKKEYYVTLRNILYCPNARNNLISEGRMEKANLIILVKEGMCMILTNSNQIVMIGHCCHNLYEMDCVADPSYLSPWGPASAVGTSRHTRN